MRGGSEAAEPPYLACKSRDRVAGLSDVFDDGVETDVRRGDALGSQVQRDVQVAVQNRVIAETYETLAAEPATRLKQCDPRRRRDGESLRGGMFDLGGSVSSMP